MEQDEHSQGTGSSPDPSLLRLYPPSSQIWKVSIPVTASLRSASLGSASLEQHPREVHPWSLQHKLGSQDQAFPELKERSFPCGTAPTSPALHPCGETEVRDGTAGITRITHPQNTRPLCQGHGKWAGSAGSTGAPPGSTLSWLTDHRDPGSIPCLGAGWGQGWGPHGPTVT